MRNRSLVSECEFTHLVGWLVDPWVVTFVCISAHQCTTSLNEEKMLSNGSANVKHSEAMSDKIVTAMSTACGASIFLFELFKNQRIPMVKLVE